MIQIITGESLSIYLSLYVFYISALILFGCLRAQYGVPNIRNRYISVHVCTLIVVRGVFMYIYVL